MPDRRYRVLMIASHPVQYQSPIFRRMAQHPRLEIRVAYCNMQGAEKAMDADFGTEVQWDTPVLDGYPWVRVPNRGWRPGPGHFFGLLNPGLWKMARSDGFDAVVIFTGYAYASFWISVVAAKASRKPLLFGTDAYNVSPRDRRGWKARMKKWFWPRLFHLADIVIVPSTGSVSLMHSLGLPAERIVLTPYTVDNEWWIESSRRADRAAVRARWCIPEGAPVALFCAKLQPWKRPLDLLRAFAKAKLSTSYLVYAGDGPLRATLESEARSLGVSDRVRFLGFVNQSGLPEVYRSADLFILPSDYEPFGVVVNEAMLCGCAAAVSDCVGARFDLVHPGKSGFIFPCGDIEALGAILCEALSNPRLLRELSQAALKRMETWTIRDNVTAMVEAISKACGDKN